VLQDPWDVLDGMQLWDEEASIPHKVAEIHLPQLPNHNGFPHAADTVPFLHSLENYVDDLSFSP
jgi:hypothetical protein